MNKKWVPILCYHRVSPQSDPHHKFHSLAVTPEAFEKQMKLLKSLGYRPTTLQDAVAHFRSMKNLPDRSVVITFDDGYRDNYQYAFPILKKYSFPATIFMVTGNIGRENAWDRGSIPLLKESDIQEMQDDGIVFGSHTCSHIDMTVESESKIIDELARSKETVEAFSGRKDTVFCYPYSRFTERGKQLVREAGYLCGVSTTTGPIDQAQDLFELRRVQVFPSTSLFGFWKKIQSWYPAWNDWMLEFKKEKKRKALAGAA